MTREGCSAHADRVLVGADRAQDEGMGETRWHFGTGAEVFGRHARGGSGQARGRQEVPGRAFTLQEPHVEVLRGEPRTSRRGHGAQLTEHGTGEVVCQRRGRRSTCEMTEMHEGDSSPRCVPQYRRRVPENFQLRVTRRNSDVSEIIDISLGGVCIVDRLRTRLVTMHLGHFFRFAFVGAKAHRNRPYSHVSGQ